MQLKATEFGKLEGTVVTKFTIKNDKGLEISLIDYGATLISLKWQDSEAQADELTLNLPSIEDIVSRSPYFGSTCGRVANRIANGKFKLDGVEFSLAINNGPNHLHGGLKNFSHVMWTAEPFQADQSAGVAFSLLSPDGDEGYPGNLEVRVLVSLNNKNELHFEYHATTDKATPVNLTNHTYWNLSGQCKDSIREHLVQVFADHFTPTNNSQIPTGIFSI